MLDIFISSVLTVMFFFAAGIIFKKPERNNFEWYSRLLIYGCIILSFIALIFNFFLPLSKNLNSFIFMLIVSTLFFRTNYFINKKFIFFLIISSFIILILLFGSHTYRPDSGLYHFPYIQILNEEKIILGLSNLHFRFGHISIIQYLSAINYNSVYGLNGIVFPTAVIACAVLINFSTYIFNYIKSKNFNFHFFFLLGVFSYICFKMNRYGEYGNDAPTHFLTFFLISEILYFKFKLKTKDAIILFNISLFIILNKVTMFFVILLPFVFIKKIIFKKILKNLKTYFAIIFGLLWIIKNILISGCLIYPISFSCVDHLAWTDTQKVKEISLENEAFSKNWPNYEKRSDNTQSFYVSDFNWLKTWAKAQKKHKEILLPYIVFLIFIYLYIFFKSKQSNQKINKNYKFLFLILSLMFILWFVKIPTYRYGYSIIISLISIFFASFCFQREELNKIFFKKFCLIIFTFLISIFVIKNFYRIIKTNYYVNYPFPKFYSHGENNKKSDNYSSKTINNITIYKEENGFCMYNKPICTPYDINIKIKKSNGYLIFIKD